MNIKLINAIRKTKQKLIERVKNRGIYENFGAKEIGQLHDKFIDLSSYTNEMNDRRDLISQFNNWCGWYNGGD